MASYQPNSLAEFEPFFAGDPKGPYMVQAMFTGTDYTTSRPAALMKELLRADNYVNFQNNRSSVSGQAQGSEDVHQDITDLVITTALFHRAIDQTQLVGAETKKIFDKLNKNINELLDGTVATLNPRDISVSSFTVNRSLTSVNTHYGITGASTVGDLYLYILLDRAMWDVWNSTNTGHSMDSLDMSNDSAGLKHNDYLDALSTCTTVRTICSFLTSLNSLWTTDVIPFITKKHGIALNFLNNFRANLINELGSIILDMKKSINGNYGSSLLTFSDIVMGSAGRMTVNNFINDARTKANYKNMLSEAFNRAFMNAFKDQLAILSVGHTDLNNPDAWTFFDAVYKNWPSMHRDTRDFYRQNIALFVKSTATDLYDVSISDAQRKQASKSGWVWLTEKEIDDLFTSGKNLATRKLDLRLNLMKKKPGVDESILFGANLPDVDAGSTVWFTQSTGGFGTVLNAPKDFLRELYNVSYTAPATPMTVKGLVVNSVELDLTKRSKNKINLSLGKFISAVLKREDDISRQEQLAKSQAMPPVDLSLDVYTFLQSVDMAYGKVWTFDSQKGQHYRVENGRKVYYDEAVAGDTRTCYATYLANGNSGKCNRLIECIIDNNPSSLSRCLDVIGDGNLWEVAEDDILKVGPDRVRTVLKKFGIMGKVEKDYSTGVSYKIPVTFEKWMKDVVENFDDPDVKKTIKSNTKLLTYIRALITLCRNNPSILNKDVPQIVAKENVPVYAQNLNMRRYMVPASSKKTQYEFFAELLRNEQMPRIVNNDLWNPIISGNMSNISFFSPYMTRMPAMMGGNLFAVNPTLQSTGTTNISRQFSQIGRVSDIYSHLLSSITNALNDVGITMHSIDVARLDTAVKQLKKYEEDLAKLCIALNNVVKLARFYGISLDNVSKDNLKVLKLSDIHSWEDVTRFVKSYASAITKNMVTNMSIQQATAFELMHQIGPRFLNTCTGKKEDIPDEKEEDDETVPI